MWGVRTRDTGNGGIGGGGGAGPTCHRDIFVAGKISSKDIKSKLYSCSAPPRRALCTARTNNAPLGVPLFRARGRHCVKYAVISIILGNCRERQLLHSLTTRLSPQTKTVYRPTPVSTLDMLEPKTQSKPSIATDRITPLTQIRKRKGTQRRS